MDAGNSQVVVYLRCTPRDLDFSQDLVDEMPGADCKMVPATAERPDNPGSGWTIEVLLPDAVARGVKFWTSADERGGVKVALLPLGEVPGRGTYLQSLLGADYRVAMEDALPLLQGLLNREVPRRLKAISSPSVVLIGASAGGVDAFRRLLQLLPDELESPVVLMLHRKREPKSNHDDRLLTLLQDVCLRTISACEDGLELQHRGVYLAPQGQHTLLNGTEFELQAGDGGSAWCPSINLLFRSAAESFAGTVVGVVLTGMLNDGADGLRSITAKGGVTVAQHPGDAKEPGMPLSALTQDHPNYVVDLPELWPVLIEAGQPEFPSDISGSSPALISARRARRLKASLATPPYNAFRTISG